MDRVITRNAYFDHHENILLAMLADNDYNVRLLAVNKILSIRESNKNLDNIGRDEEVDVRKFIIPKISTNAKLIVLFFVLFAIFILHSRESELYRYTLDGKSALAWELPFSRFMGHLSFT